MAFNFNLKPKSLSLLVGVLAVTLAACSGGETDTTTTTDDTAAADGGSGLSGDVLVDGSSTVFPISEAMAEEFMNENPDVRVTVGVSGSGGGFKKFCAGETDISNASRPIKESEMELCEEAGIEYVELPVAFDGISVVVHPDNDWVECLTPDELGAMWEPDAEGTITNWNQIRDTFPDKPLSLYGPGTDSGTYDYFTDATVGEEGESRGDYTASEDDNVIVQGVSTDDGGLGFFGFAYYEENKDSLKIVPIENANGECVVPSEEVIADGSYNPLARPIFFYVKTESLENKPAVAAFAQYHLAQENQDLVSEVGYVPLKDELLTKASDRLDNQVIGTMFEGGSSLGVKLSDKL
ncbi:PstS family phosphate ABC transporter substrate-binding protein [Baaleninema simplex]|uniref:PstS family phosphate ABC transporter substrate-binding protein n=1 Tax=Baaleninema simplex TaxID=2862350 RepID=UPI00034BD04A|nr:PstS family phosphate ABC transporter substrate-binding protein [Baaleninema simplex]